MRLGDGSDDEGTPARLQQGFEVCVPVGELLELHAHEGCEVEELGDEVVERLTAENGARKEGAGTAVQIFEDVLEIVAELEEDSPEKGEATLLRSEVAVDQEGVGENGRAAFGATDAEELGWTEGKGGVELNDAGGLGMVNGKERLVNGGIERAGKLIFDDPDELPDEGFAEVADEEHVAGETAAEAVGELLLFGPRGRGLVDVVVAVGVEEAVGEDAGAERDFCAEEGLESAGSPGIAAGLSDVVLGERGVEAPGPGGELGADGEELGGEALDGGLAQVEGFGSEAGKRADKAGFENVRIDAAGRAGDALHVPESAVVGGLAAALLAGDVAGLGSTPWAVGAMPEVDAVAEECRFRLRGVGGVHGLVVRTRRGYGSAGVTLRGR